MGIRFTTNTWRSPLQLIDCWLPPNPIHAPAQPMKMPRSLQKFVRAGWLNRSAPVGRPASLELSTNQGIARPCKQLDDIGTQRRAQPTSVQVHPDARLVISGRIGDVCAELDRLAALELRSVQ